MVTPTKAEKQNNYMTQKQALKFLLIGIPLCFMISDVLKTVGHVMEERREFKGVVQEIFIDKKGLPWVTVNGETYLLAHTGKVFNNEIAMGDSLVKIKNSTTYKLIKNTEHRVLLSNDY